MPSLFAQCEFLTSAYRCDQLPPDQGQEVAFAGRSNAGKSTAINVLTNNKRMAKVSKTPGRTQLFNCFSLQTDRRLVDLPGYGYAKVPEKMRRHWQHEINLYLQKRASLIGVVVIMDIRHPLKEFDRQMIEWADLSQMHSHVLLNKADKFSGGKARAVLHGVRRELKHLSGSTTVQTFSALKSEGREALSKVLTGWFEGE